MNRERKVFKDLFSYNNDVIFCISDVTIFFGLFLVNGHSLHSSFFFGYQTQLDKNKVIM